MVWIKLVICQDQGDLNKVGLQTLRTENFQTEALHLVEQFLKACPKEYVYGAILKNDMRQMFLSNQRIMRNLIIYDYFKMFIIYLLGKEHA